MTGSSLAKFLQRYICGDISEVHVHFRVKGMNTLPEEFCAVFGRPDECGRACDGASELTGSWCRRPSFNSFQVIAIAAEGPRA
jgi:hypothetical protein